MTGSEPTAENPRWDRNLILFYGIYRIQGFKFVLTSWKWQLAKIVSFQLWILKLKVALFCKTNFNPFGNQKIDNSIQPNCFLIKTAQLCNNFFFSFFYFRGEPFVYEAGWKDGCAVFFYTLICIILHAILQEYVLDVSF